MPSRWHRVRSPLHEGRRGGELQRPCHVLVVRGCAWWGEIVLGTFFRDEKKERPCGRSLECSGLFPDGGDQGCDGLPSWALSFLRAFQASYSAREIVPSPPVSISATISCNFGWAARSARPTRPSRRVSRSA